MKEKPERKFHEVAELFPLLEGEAFEELVKDIERNGLRAPILVDAKGAIIDGRNRYRACQVAKVEPRYEEWWGEGSLEEASLSLNLRRRHLGESQKGWKQRRLRGDLGITAFSLQICREQNWESHGSQRRCGSTSRRGSRRTR